MATPWSLAQTTRGRGIDSLCMVMHGKIAVAFADGAEEEDVALTGADGVAEGEEDFKRMTIGSMALGRVRKVTRRV